MPNTRGHCSHHGVPRILSCVQSMWSQCGLGPFCRPALTSLALLRDSFRLPEAPPPDPGLRDCIFRVFSLTPTLRILDHYCSPATSQFSLGSDTPEGLAGLPWDLSPRGAPGCQALTQTFCTLDLGFCHAATVTWGWLGQSPGCSPLTWQFP